MRRSLEMDSERAALCQGYRFHFSMQPYGGLEAIPSECTSVHWIWEMMYALIGKVQCFVGIPAAFPQYFVQDFFSDSKMWPLSIKNAWNILVVLRAGHVYSKAWMRWIILCHIYWCFQCWFNAHRSSAIYWTPAICELLSFFVSFIENKHDCPLQIIFVRFIPPPIQDGGFYGGRHLDSQDRMGFVVCQ